MSIGPTVFHQRSLPFPTLACLAIAAFFVLQAIVVNGWMMVLSLALAVLFLFAAGWYLLEARRSSVLIDAEQFIVKAGARQTTFERADIASVDLSSPVGHIVLKDGSIITLPLEGDELVRAGLLLTPSGQIPRTT